MASSTPLKTLSKVRAFNGFLHRYEHLSSVLSSGGSSESSGLPMKFAVFIPDQVGQDSSKKIPTLFYLSGLTCTDENVSQKGSIAFKYLSEFGIAMVMPDTSPRGHEEIPREHDSWDFGSGAGFYLNATTEGYKKNYKMYDYITLELPQLLQSCFSWYNPSNISITGHSMGGHGSLTIALKNPTMYKSVSAFAPICNPSIVPWGEKAFKGYLMNPEEESKMYDSCVLMEELNMKFTNSPIYVDQGTKDNFYCGEVNQLQTGRLEEVCKKVGQECIVNYREEYDHGYYFISSFFEDHIKFHAKYLGA